MAKKEIIDLFNLTKQEIDSDISHYQFTITGAYGAGKSTFANALFNKVGSAVTFGFEDRFKGIKDIRVIPITTWTEALEYKKMLKKGFKENGGVNPFDFNTIVFDPVGRAAKLCEEYVCDENGWETLADGSYGKGYAVFEDEFNSYVMDLKRMGFIIANIAHGRTDTITPPRASEGYQVFVPDVPKKLKYAVQGEADFVLYLDVLRQVDETTGINRPVRRLYLQNYADYELKVPLEGLPDYIEYETVEEGVNKFIEAFNEAVNITGGGKKTEQPKKDNIKERPQKQEPPKDDIYELKNEAIEVRDKLLKNIDKEIVVDLLVKFLGTPNISECNDKDGLTSFIEQNKF